MVKITSNLEVLFFGSYFTGPDVLHQKSQTTQFYSSL